MIQNNTKMEPMWFIFTQKYHQGDCVVKIFWSPSSNLAWGRAGTQWQCYGGWRCPRSVCLARAQREAGLPSRAEKWHRWMLYRSPHPRAARGQSEEFLSPCRAQRTWRLLLGCWLSNGRSTLPLLGRWIFLCAQSKRETVKQLPRNKGSYKASLLRRKNETRSVLTFINKL